MSVGDLGGHPSQSSETTCDDAAARPANLQLHNGRVHLSKRPGNCYLGLRTLFHTVTGNVASF